MNFLRNNKGQFINGDIGLDTDHINGNGLDNRKENLRICSHRQNLFNHKVNKRNKVGIKGVCFRKDTQRWTAQIAFNGVKKTLGCFDTAQEAGNTYQVEAANFLGF